MTREELENMVNEIIEQRMTGKSVWLSEINYNTLAKALDMLAERINSIYIPYQFFLDILFRIARKERRNLNQNELQNLIPLLRGIGWKVVKDGGRLFVTKIE